MTVAVYSHETGRQEDDGVDEAYNPFVFACAVNAEFFGKGQVGTVGTGLIPALGSCSDSTERDRVPEHKGAMPFVTHLVCERSTLLLVELGDGLESCGISGDESSAPEQTGVLWHAMRPGKFLGIEDGLLA